jgi:hypothetical protein
MSVFDVLFILFMTGIIIYHRQISKLAERRVAESIR